AESLGARVIRQYPPKGYGTAMDTALRSGNRAVTVTMDCDGTYPSGDIEKLARMVLEDGFDVVDGCRLRQKPSAMRWVNYIGNRVFAMIASILFGTMIYDLHSGMRAYRKGVPESLGYDPKGAALPVELLLAPIRKGMKVKSVPIPYNERIGHSVMNPIDSSWWTIKRILKVRFR
ncbi:MAG: glycosyltransferase family 2 protein, partial [Rhodospirillales bacterium]